MEVHCKAKKSTSQISARQQSVIKARLKLVMQNFFFAKSIYKCVTDDESYFTVESKKLLCILYSGNSNESEDHPAVEDVKFIRKTKFSAKVLLWLAVSESGIKANQCFSKPDLQSTKKCTYPNVYHYFINLSKNTSKTKKSCAQYAKDTLI
jgi:hypothetical protein